MAVFTKKTLENGKIQYRKDGILVKKEDINASVVEKLDIAPEGTQVPESDEIDTNVVPLAETPQDVKLVKIHLEHNICINGKAYLGGTKIDENDEEVDVEIEVPEDIAEDLKRIDKENTRYEKNLHRGQDNVRKSASVRVEAINAAEY